ncbi:hypothetical protein IJ425_08700 [bacterium]|nr:hypothetical protein [bacterium]
MDLSINKLNQTKKNVNFKGLEGAYNINSTPVFKFIAPPHKKNEKVYLEITPLQPDKKTAGYKKPKKETIESIQFREDDILELNQEMVRRLSSGFAYRYKIVDSSTKQSRYEVDSFKTMKINDNNEVMNVIEQGRMYGISPKGGTMRHSFLDSDVRLNSSQNGIQRNKEFVRNHFNKLGGSINGLLWMLKNTDELEPYRYFMTTPDIGVDKVSSHRYWPSNQYQCSDFDVFKDFNFELFKQGKGYIADGAFTSQGIQSPLVQHVLKWGEESPFYNMLKIDGKISLGVLPDVSAIDGVDPYQHIGVRLVNPKDKNYDKNKPTYIQFYDDRLLSKQKQNDGKLHFDYDASPQDHYEITSHQDSVQPYAFEINPNDKKIKAFEGKNAILLKDLKNPYDFLTFPNFTIEQKNKVAGATCWDGNVDIIKMNLSNPNTAKKANVEGFRNAREYLFGVATYWSEAIQGHLILETAKIKNEKTLKEIALKNDITPTRYEKIKNGLNNFDSLVLKEGKTAQDYVAQFPLQSLETSEELSAIFAQPQFLEELLYGQTQDDIAAIFDSTINNALPKEYKNDEQYKAYVAKTYGNEILRHIYTSALDIDAIDDKGTINTDKLKKVTLKSIERHASSSPREERSQVISHIKSNLIPEGTSALQKRMKSELKNISLDDFKLAEAIVLQGKGGLNWRFDAAKDIGDLDAVRDGKKTFNQIWNGDLGTPGVQAFWSEFVSRIKAHNPSAYIINEVTSLGEFCDYNNPKSLRQFDPQLAEAYLSLPDSEKRYERHPIYAKQVQFLDTTNSTTTSEYSKGFNAFSKFAGVNPEKEMNAQGNDYASTRLSAGDLGALKTAMDSLMQFNQPNSAIFSHMFVSNHDKPSVLHTLPLNMSIYMAKDLNTLNAKDKEAITQLTGGRTDFDNICAKAAGVGLAMKKVIENSDKYSKKEKEALLQSLENLVNGKKTKTDKPNYKRAESFGIKPYEITIGDLLKGAKMYSENNVLDFHHEMMQDSMTYYERMWQVMNSCVGTPTLYGGNEFVQTGYETPSKNVYLGIRNEILHHLKSDKRYKAYYENMFAISGLYQKPGLSALRNGTPISLKLVSNLDKEEEKLKQEINALADKTGIHPGKLNYLATQVVNYIDSERSLQKTSDGSFKNETFEELKTRISSNKEKASNIISKTLGIKNEDNNHEFFKKGIKEVFEAAQKIHDLRSKEKISMWPIYKKDSTGSQVVSVITNLGLPNKKASFESNPQPINHSVNSIPLVDDKGICPFENGTKLTKISPYGDNKTAGFVVKNGAIVKENGGKFTLNDTVSIFYPEKTLYL